MTVKVIEYYIIFILIQSFNDLVCPVVGDILEESALGIETCHNRIKVSRKNNVVFFFSDASL